MLGKQCDVVMEPFARRHFFCAAKESSPFPAALVLLSLLVFAIRANLPAGLFLVNETKEMTATASKTHGFGSAIGFAARLFFRS